TLEDSRPTALSFASRTMCLHPKWLCCGYFTKIITLKDIPAPIHAALKQRAKLHGRSLNKEVLACLEMAVTPSRVDPNTLLYEMSAHRASLPGKLDGRLIRNALEVGRA
ncbi:MAG TPA: hypothetical protein PJ991_07720, partial [Kiritimatiellia bacterium]|nr:hypothetical protein [Kiritimatiellia bacterium]